MQMILLLECNEAYTISF